MKITLQVNGREMTFSEEELIAILEEHFGDKTSKTEAQTTKGVQTEDKKTKPTKTQAKGKYFDVIPSSIDRSLFQEKREDKEQEWTRQFILEAFDEVDKHPEEYAKPFKVMVPKKTWESTDLQDLYKLARKLGDHVANWVELALVWAQRISNGDIWEDIIDLRNKLDTEKVCYILFKWKDGTSRIANYKGIHYMENIECRFLYITMPLVVCYEEDCPLPDRMAS